MCLPPPFLRAPCRAVPHTTVTDPETGRHRDPQTLPAAARAREEAAQVQLQLPLVAGDLPADDGRLQGHVQAQPDARVPQLLEVLGGDQRLEAVRVLLLLLLFLYVLELVLFGLLRRGARRGGAVGLGSDFGGSSRSGTRRRAGVAR